MRHEEKKQAEQEPRKETETKPTHAAPPTNGRRGPREADSPGEGGKGWEMEKLRKNPKEEPSEEKNNPSKWSWCAGTVTLRGQQTRPKDSSVVATTGKRTQSHRVWSKNPHRRLATRGNSEAVVRCGLCPPPIAKQGRGQPQGTEGTCAGDQILPPPREVRTEKKLKNVK
jgi:hypothetical protein